MDNRLQTHNHKLMRRVWMVAAGIAVNVVLSLVMERVGMPLFLDTVGTIAVSAVCGLFPGILTAVVTNVVCSLFNGDAIYFGFINALVAVYTVWFDRKYTLKSLKKLGLFVLGMSLFVGVLSSIIHWFLLKDPQRAVILSELAQTLASATGMESFSAYVVMNILLNVVDKGISAAVALLVLVVIPRQALKEIRDSSWRQRPLTDPEIKSMKEWGKNVRFSLRSRMTMTLLVVSLVLVAATSWIGVSLYFNNEKAAKTESAWNAVKFVAEIVDPDKVDAYLENGTEEPGYSETKKMMYSIRENASGVEYLYLLRVEEDGCYFIIDLDTEDTPGYEPGEKAEFEEAFYPYLPALLAGEEIEPIESNDISGWVLTVYYPVRDANGVTTCYACADVSMTYMAGYMRDFAIKSLLILLGFFILIIAFGFRSTDIYTAYPVSSIAKCVDEFAIGGTDQEQLDENVRKIRKLDIRTEDEVEKLYQSLCRMTLNQAEQMRSIRRLSESTEKMQDGLIITMADMVEKRDSDTGAHIQKTSAYVKIIVEGLKKKGYYAEKITPKFMSDVVRSAPLHDVGKINISDEVLNKPGRLTDEEFAIMKTHASAGKKIMEDAISTVQGENYLKEARNMAAYHHERWDGRGYPEGLHGEVIPLSARIMAVADVFDALTSPRVYKPAFPLEKALKIIEEGSGTQFDPKCVEVFMDSLDEVKVILKKYNPER